MCESRVGRGVPRESVCASAPALVLTATRKGYVSTREARNFDKELMHASLMMTPPWHQPWSGSGGRDDPPLGPSLERKWRT